MLLKKFPLLLLCAGASTRMGELGPKGLLPFQEVPWFIWQIQQFLKAGGERVTVVLGYEYQKFLPHLETFIATTKSDRQQIQIDYAINKNPERGQFSSLQVGLSQRTTASHIFIQPVDHPILNGVGLKSLAEKVEQRPQLKVVIPEHQGRRGHPILLNTDLISNLLSLDPNHPDSRLDYQLKKIEDQEKEEITVSDSSFLLNLNDPQSWNDYCRNFQEF